MKKLLCILLAAVMLLALAACGDDTTPNKDKDKDKGKETTSTTAESTTTTTTTTTTEAEKPTTTDPVGSTTAPSSTTTTTTTTQPEEPDEPDEPEEPDNRPEIKILSIGHSFSVDAMKTYMWDLFDAAGYKATIGYLFYPGCSLERQYHYVTGNKPLYQQYCKNSDGTWDTTYNARALEALWDEDWDIVTFQPSPDYGKGTMKYDCTWGCGKQVNDYDHFDELVDYVVDTLADPSNPNGANTDVKIYYHLTWAFANDCRLWSFSYSGNNQMTMYQDFIDATKKYVIPNEHVQGVIPCITSIQNARSSYLGDTFNMPGDYDPNSDGYHLNDKGDFVAAMTWVSYFTGIKAANIDYDWSPFTDDGYKAIVEAVDNAIAKPFEVTESSYKTQP